MSLKNIKATLIFEKVLSSDGGHFKINNVSFAIYKYKRDRIHITGLKSEIMLKYYRYILEYKYKQQVIEVRIDNMFYSKKDRRNIDLYKLYYYMWKSDMYFVNYNPELFCGMILEPYNKKKSTILLFRTGSYTFLGAKSMDDIYTSNNFVNGLINMFLK